MNIESKIWKYSNTGTTVHCFEGGVVALCRSTIRRFASDAGIDYSEARDGHKLCGSCDTKFNAIIEAAEASVATAEQAPEADPATARCCEHAAMYHGARGCDNCRCTTSRSEIRPVGAASTVQPKVYDERCCEHALMYHGAKGCDTCVCNTPRNVMPVAGDVTVGRNVETEAGRVPARALLVDAVSLSWIPSVRPGAVISATNGEGVFWVYVQTEGCKARMLYVGPSMIDAIKARDAYVTWHTDYVATLARESYEHTTVTPTRVTQTIYGPIPAPPAYELDPRTGLPVVKVFDVRYVIGILQTSRFESDFVEFWAADTMGPHFGTVHRASATFHVGTVQRAVWDAHRRIRNV